MYKKCILPIFLCFLLTTCHPFSQNRLAAVKKWFILLDYKASLYPAGEKELLRYDMAILDPDNHPEIDKAKGKTILIAYVSIGEAEDYRAYWEEIKGAEWVIDENPDWKGNYYVDVRSSDWQNTIMGKVIPAAIEKGFDGIFMDTIDTSSVLESRDPERFKGSDEAMANFVKEIHKRYPGILIISNNGFSVLEEIAPVLSGMLTEDIYMMPDFENDGYKEVPAGDRAYKVAILKKLMEKYKIPVFLIDYVSQDDKPLIKQCIKDNKRLGFKPYIAEKGLDRIYEN